MAAAFDIDKRKVGKDVAEAIFERPNCTMVFCNDIKTTGIKVQMGRLLDGLSDHMRDYDDRNTFVVADQPEADKEKIVTILGESGAEVLLNYLPVGSEKATRFYAECALEAGIAFVNIENSTANVTLTAYDDSGSSVAIQSLTVGPHAKEVKVAESFFTQDISSATYISFSSDKEIVGFQLNGSADGRLLDALPGM